MKNEKTLKDLLFKKSLLILQRRCGFFKNIRNHIAKFMYCYVPKNI